MAHVPIGASAAAAHESWQERLSAITDLVEDLETDADDAGAEEVRYQLSVARAGLRKATDAARVWDDPL